MGDGSAELVTDLPVGAFAFVLRAPICANVCSSTVLSVGSGAHSHDHAGDRAGGRDLGVGPHRMS
jgi:hypothetical protein